MEAKMKALRILLIVYIVIGVMLTLYGTAAITIMSGLITGGLTFLLGFFTLVYFPYYAKSSLENNNTAPCMWHSIFIIIFSSLIFLPLAILEIVLVYKINQHLQTENA
jgi:uncharacterized membrane-anchored protein